MCQSSLRSTRWSTYFTNHLLQSPNKRCYPSQNMVSPHHALRRRPNSYLAPYLANPANPSHFCHSARHNTVDTSWLYRSSGPRLPSRHRRTPWNAFALDPHLYAFAGWPLQHVSHAMPSLNLGTNQPSRFVRASLHQAHIVRS